MLLVPAVDILDGHVVRLVQGRLDTVIRYGRTPLDWARKWAEEGADTIHVVDLGAAMCGRPSVESVVQIAQDLDIPIQAAGGIRDREKACLLLEAGVSRVVLGTLAATDPCAVRTLVREYGPDRLAIAVDYLGGTLHIRGWTGTVMTTLAGYIDRMAELGIRTVVATAISRDGMLKGPDLYGLREIRGIARGTLYAAGGISSIDDILLLNRCGVDGAILGRSLYEGRVCLQDAARALREGC
ncbi:MAG: 1-(5-phosphoribosyl)-5-[(5-phosphoribosylamino)methylideneamino] imidazole-4-carboxamide isomerase [Candidatus Thorarchaeota archaeon]